MRWGIIGDSSFAMFFSTAESLDNVIGGLKEAVKEKNVEDMQFWIVRIRYWTNELIKDMEDIHIGEVQQFDPCV
jgi:hypothetical protein